MSTNRNSTQASGADDSGAAFSARGSRILGNAIGRRAVLAGGIGGLAAIALAACSGASTAAPEGTAAAGKTELVVAVPALAPTLDGVVGGGGTTLESFEMNANLQAGLVRNPYIEGKTADTVVQDFNEYVGYLAESYTVSDDGLTYTFVLRDGLVSPLGNAITADDVLYSFERKWAVPTYSKTVWAAGFADPATQLVKIDDKTVAFTLSNAGFGLTFLGLLANLQGHIYDSTALKANATTDDPYTLVWAKANGGWGLGPYYVTSQTPDQEMVLTANPGYAYGEPAIKKVTLRVVGDAGTRATLVSTGDVDMAEGTRPTDQARLANVEGVVVPEADPIEFVDLTLVSNKAPFDNELVRQAMAYAVPYEEIMTQIYSGRAVPTIGNINPNTKNYSTDDLPTYEYDVKKAKALLAQAGLESVDFTLSVSTATTDLVDASVLIKSYAQDAGFNITINQQTAADFGTARANATNQAIIYRNRCQVQTPTYSCTVFFKPNNDSSNPSRWEDASSLVFWESVNKATAEADPLSEAAGGYWQDAQTVLIESAPEIFICSIQPSQIFRTSVKGFTYRSENAIDFGNITA